MGHLWKADLVPLWLVLEDKTAEGRETGNDCFGSQAVDTDLHDAEDGKALQRRMF